MTKWRQTGKRETVPTPTGEMRVLAVDDHWIELVRAGDFDGYVYVGMANGPTLEWVRFRAKLIEEDVSLPEDYADTAE